MLRTFDIILIGLMIAAASITYKIKHDAEKQMNQVTKLERMISDQNDTIDLLKAGRSLLTQPNRLQKLIETFQGQLDLQLVEANQIIDIDGSAPDQSRLFLTLSQTLSPKPAPRTLKPDSTLTGSVAKKANPAPKRSCTIMAAVWIKRTKIDLGSLELRRPLPWMQKRRNQAIARATVLSWPLLAS